MLGLKSLINRYYSSWLNRRLPVASEITLTQRRIFIFPSKVGWLFLLMLALLFVTGINYQNNLILTVGFILISVFLTTIIATYQNVSGVMIKASASDAVYLGDTVYLPITLINNHKSSRAGFCIGFIKNELQMIDVLEHQHYLKLPYIPEKRGVLKVPRIKFYSVFPLGVFTCWSWLRLDFKGLVYPTPIDMPFRRSTESGYEDEGQNLAQKGNDEYQGLKKYQKGDSLKRVAWKQFAKNKQLMTKEYEDVKGNDRMLDWHSLAGFDTEERLQILCGWILKASEQNSEFGLILPGITIALAEGDKHKEACLKALALYPQVEK